jgi:fructose-1,6-bisphosphatase/inositol monophosphatase family enzyme
LPCKCNLQRYATAESADSMIKGMTALTALPVRSIRMLGSAAIMLAWVATGRLTAYYEADLNSWDTAAGALLVREAGGRITDLCTGWGSFIASLYAAVFMFTLFTQFTQFILY